MRHSLWSLALALAVLPGVSGHLRAEKPDRPRQLPPSADVQALAVQPNQIVLRGSEAAQQLIITATLRDGRLCDLSGDVRYEVADPELVRVNGIGQVVPLGTGVTRITARYGDRTVQVPVRAEADDDPPAIRFANQIVPVFTKLGCNSGACHGKSSGQNGFKLSLLGFEPANDFAALVKESRGRRLFPAAPDHSLLLLKATGQLSHGGGKRMEVGSAGYRLVRRWIAAGTPSDRPDDPVVTRVTVHPEQRILTRNDQQQIAVTAHYSDGSAEDVTRWAQYESNNTAAAVIDGAGLVRTRDQLGEAVIMIRYQGHVATFRALVPLGVKIPDYSFTPATLVDPYTQKKWKELGIAPSDLCADEQFIRRVSLDITGTLPTPARVLAFVADKEPAKRDKLVDALLETPEYSYYFAGKWADVLRVRRGRGTDPERGAGTLAFHNWIREVIAADKPYDQFVRALLEATGTQKQNPAVVWYKDLQQPEQLVDDLAQVFLGLRLQCAQCHHHPYEKWSQDDYWGLAAFFGRVGRTDVGPGKSKEKQPLTISVRPNGDVVNRRTGRPAVLTPLDDAPVVVGKEQDPRHALADWMVSGQNPFFARAVVNRYWASFFSRGIVHPLDDMRVTNPPTNPELLDALAKDFIAHGFSLKHLIRTICKSRTYQLSSTANEFNLRDRQNFARYYPRRMSTEVLLDAVSQVTSSPSSFGKLPDGRLAPERAIMLPDEAFPSEFLNAFGRPARTSSCECERDGESTLAQALHLLNSAEVQGKLSRPGGRTDTLGKDSRPDAEKVEELFLWAFARRPSPAESAAALAHLTRHASSKKLAYENILWALINSKEFVFHR